MDNEPTKNEQSDQSFLRRREGNSRSRQKPTGPQKPDAINPMAEQAKPAKPEAEKKRLPSFEEIVASQEEIVNTPLSDNDADIVSNDEKSEDDRIDPLESLKELKVAVSKTEVELSTEEIDSLLHVQETDTAEEENEIDENRSDDDSDEASADAIDGTGALSSLKDTIAQAQSEIGDDDQENTESFHIGAAKDEQPLITSKNESKIPDGQIPRFELTEKILTEQRKVASGRRTRKSENTQKSNRNNITGLLGEVVRADRKVVSEPAGSFSIGGKNAGDSFKYPQERSSQPGGNARYTPAVYSILRGENDLTQIQRVIIADIVARDISEHFPQMDSQMQVHVPA